MNLPSWREDLTDWDDNKVASVLDLLKGNIAMASRQFWLDRVSNTQPLTDVTESGSSSPQSQNHEHAVAMLKYWDTNIALAPQSKTVKIKKRYPTRQGGFISADDYGYGGVYVRSD